jgi:hypothetical protein
MGAVFTVGNTVQREKRVREDKRFETDRRRLPEEELDRELGSGYLATSSHFSFLGLCYCCTVRTLWI